MPLKLGNPATLAELGSGTGDGQALGLYRSHRCESLLLRSAESLAAWNERKYQSSAPTVFPARHRPVSHLASAARLAALESTSKKDFRL